RDGYCGYVLAAALSRQEAATHWIAAPATHLYPKPRLKTPPEVSLFFGSQVRVVSDADDFQKISTGHYVPTGHLQPLRARFGDWVGVADMFLGTPYLWGGSSRWGIDCSGLVQTALTACGLDCPRDSDQQRALVGRELHSDEPLKRGDLVFWAGHVGLMSDPDTLLHANAHHMTVAYEPLEEAKARIATSSGDGTGRGEIVMRRRPGRD
ncbi:MAG: C40 family peptidase, partial [Pseudomonadota bacterium]